jgi:hypothetical protein
MLSQTLTAFHDAVSLLLRGQVERRNVLEGLDLVLLAADETVDDGYVFHQVTTKKGMARSRN